MYQFSGKLKLASIILMVVGALGIGFGFYSAPKTVEEATEMTASHQEHMTHDVPASSHDVSKADTHATTEHHDDAHAEHVFHQLKNRPWAAFYVSLFFFLGITLLVLTFYAIQRAAQAGWSIVLFRVMEAITANLYYVSIIMLFFLIAAFMHINHLFPWMAEGTTTPGHENFDAIVYGKKWWLNTPGWLLRSIVYLVGWNFYRYFVRKNSIAQDNGDLKIHGKLYKASIAFVAFFMISETMMSWDWIMGIDPHWFSTLFGWYVLSTFMVTAITVIAFVTIYLRSKGHLPFVNDSHIHDLTKYMFGFSVFWTYLWFSQFMLIWYADMAEETVYFAMRFEHYNFLFLGMVVLNFVLPILLLINSDFKSIPWFVVIGGVFIIFGHYIDVFVMIVPGTVGANWSFGIPEIGGFLFFLGIFIYATFNAFAKAAPLAKGNPYLKESEDYHYYIIEHRGEEDSHH